MGNRLDLSWDTIPCDGASTPVVMPPASDPSETEDLFRAWCQERHENIETKLYLDEALRVLKRLLADGRVSAQARKRAQRLFLAIKHSSNQTGEESA